jgi:hypothetical protein
MEDEILRTALAPGAECLSIEQLGRYANGELGAGEQRAADLHVRSCLSCQAELALLQAVMSSSVRPGEDDVVRDGAARLEQRRMEIPAAPRPATSPRSRWPGFGIIPSAAVAAIAVFGTAAGFYVLFVQRAPQLPGDVATQNEVTRSLAIAVRVPVGDQIELPRRFEWLAVDGAVRYRLRLLEVDRREVWSTSTSAPGVDLPPPIQPAIVPGRTMLWEVTAYDAAGMALAESGMQSFRVQPR